MGVRRARARGRLNAAMIQAALAATGLVAAGAAAHGAFHRNSPFFGGSLGRLPGAGRIVSLTFDDGPNPVATPRILAALKAKGVRATFFLLGRHVEQWPDLARAVVDAGHQVGNHGYSHARLYRRGPGFTRNDLTKGTDAIERATGVRPRLFRAPHGFRAPWVTPIARSLGQRTIGWTLGVWDTDRPGSEEIARRAVAGARPGTILLLHDGDGYDPKGDRAQTAAAVSLIVDGLRGRGYKFDTLPE
jgi:peptidoglycan/xylan/chitin deacetylase (PgdA/CDA1 family)